MQNPNEPGRRRDPLEDLQARVERALNELRPRVRRAFEELDASLDAALSDLKPRMDQRMDSAAADLQPRLDALLRRMQESLEELRRDLEQRAARGGGTASAPPRGDDPGDPDEPIEGPSGL